MSDMKQWALYYRALGLSVFPVVSGQKMPLVSWKEYQERLPNEEEIETWWNQWPQADIGCVTGRTSGLLVLDIDGDEGRRSIDIYEIPSVPKVRTRRGFQVYFNMVDTGARTTVAGVLPGVDVRGEGGMVKMPPSLCSDGSRYEWLNGLETPRVEPPGWLLDLLKPRQAYEARQKGWVAEALTNLTDGTKHATLISVFGRLRNDNYAKEDAFAFVWPYAQEKGVSEADIWERIESVWTLYPPKEQQLTDLLTFDVGVESYLEKLQARAQHVEPEFVTGFPSLDRLTRGFPRKNIYVIGAPTNGGKTQFVLSSIHALLKKGKRVLYFSTEMPQEEIMDRFNAIGAGIPLDELRSGFLKAASRAKLVNYLQDTNTSNFIISPEDTPTLETVRSSVEKAKPDILIIDHLHHVKTQGLDRRIAIDDFITGLKKLIIEKNMPVVVTAQLKRKDAMPGAKVSYGMHDFKESGGIENEAGVCLLLCPPDAWTGDRVQNVTAYIPKNRHGRREVRFTLEFDTEIVRFQEPNIV